MKQENKDRAAQKKNERTRERTQRGRAADIPEPGLRLLQGIKESILIRV